MTRTRACLLGALAAAALLSLAARPLWRPNTAPPHVSVEPSRILADGVDSADIFITPQTPSRSAPRVSLENPRAASIDDLAPSGAGWRARIRASMPGRIRLRVDFERQPAAIVELTATLSAADEFADGTPDFLRLTDERDRQAFRRWFTFLAEAQFFQSPAARPVEIVDCAALIRYAYRGALSAHETGWAEEARLPIVPAIAVVEKYRYPYTALGASLFRVAPGAFAAADLERGAFAQFADAKTLCARNTHPVGRNLSGALPGDLLFFRQAHGRDTYHSMIYLGASQLRPGRERYVVYHTGPDEAGAGEIRRPSLDELLRHPQPEWRPIAGNPAFLGVYRWNILRRETADDDFGRE
jgi:uncharacterized protein